MTTLTKIVKPFGREFPLAYQWLAVVAGSLAIAGFAQLEIRMPFTPVPISLGPLGVLLVGAMMGSRRGALAVMTYLVEGACGMPVFSGGAFGMAALLGPTGGYLFGYVAAAFVGGYLVESAAPITYRKALIAMAAAYSMFFVFGLPWLGFWVGFGNVLTAGLYPFIPGAVCKVIAAAAVVSGRERLS